MFIVLDASALILLDQLELLTALLRSGLKIVVPRATLAEVDSPTSHAEARNGVLTIVEVDDELVPLEHRPGLGAGETAVLAFCIASPTSWAVIDEDLGRQVAKALGLRIVGTARLLSFMVSQGMCGKVLLGDLLARLRQVGFWIDDQTIAAVLSEPPPNLRE